MATARRRKIGSRRRVEDEADEEGGIDALDLDDDSLSDGSLVTDDHERGEDSDTSNIDETSPAVLNGKKKINGLAKPNKEDVSKSADKGVSVKAVTDTEMMLHGLSVADQPERPQELHFDDAAVSAGRLSPNAPIVVSSASARDPSEQPGGRRRQEHEDYKKRRDEDPAFVPNRGSFFMHDHRHPGPAANGFRPFGRGRGRGGRGGIGGPFAPMSHIHHPPDPTTSSPWTHDMHEVVANPGPRRYRPSPHAPPMHNGHPHAPTSKPSETPINRIMSTEKHLGKLQVRVMLPGQEEPRSFPGVTIKAYTTLPNHRPPLRTDKPVRISLPNCPPRYIYPNVDRAFIFIPRAMRPNQQRTRGKPRSGFGSIGGYSRHTSYYGGSIYSPSVAMSRRSSMAHDRDYMFSPTGSIASRPPVAAVEASRPVVRLPPAAQDSLALGQSMDFSGLGQPADTSINNFPQPQIYPLPQKPAFQENQPTQIPMHQPRPQKNISVADIDSPHLSQGSQGFQTAFHQQMPVHMTNGISQENHSRQPSYPSQHSGGTPLSQIPERAIHAAPFQPHQFGQSQSQLQQPPMYYSQQQQQHQHHSSYAAQQQQPGYFYPPGYQGPPSMPPSQGSGFAPPVQHSEPSTANAPPGMVAQEVNGMVYYYDPGQMAPTNPYQTYPANQTYQGSVMGMGGMVTPSPDAYYYPQGPPAPGMVYYPQ